MEGRGREGRGGASGVQGQTPHESRPALPSMVFTGIWITGGTWGPVTLLSLRKELRTRVGRSGVGSGRVGGPDENPVV